MVARAMAWRFLSLLLSSLLTLELTGVWAASIPTTTGPEPAAETPRPNEFDIGYLIVAPKVLVSDTEETICITLHNMTGPIEVAIRLMDNVTVLDKPAVQFMEFRMACYNIQVPSIEVESMQATLVIKMRRSLVTQSGFEVTEKRLVTINGVNTEMFMETDKPIYKPGQTVKFRIININQQLKPDLAPVDKIWVESPTGVRTQQWREQEGEDGLIDLEMPMTPDPVLGTWSINAIHKGRKTTKTFQVDEYVLPKFEILITPPAFVMINESNIAVKICGRYTYGQPVRGSFEARVTVKSEGWNSRERRILTQEVEDTGPAGCSEFRVDVSRLELNSTDFSIWNARLSIEADFTEASTGVTLSATSETAKITRDALILQFDAPNIFKPGVPYYGKIFVTYPDGSPAPGKTISLSCNTDQGKVFEKNFTSPEDGTIDFAVTDINITSTSLSLYAHAPGFTITQRETYGLGRSRAYTLYDPATSHYARPQYSPSGSFLQLSPITGLASVGSEQILTIDYTANDPEEALRFRFVVMSRGNIISARFYLPHKRSTRQADIPVVDAEDIPIVDAGGLFVPDEGPSIPLDVQSESQSDIIGGSMSSFSSALSFVPPTDPPVIIVEPGELYSRKVGFLVTPDMVPETRILAYYIRADGEVVADSIAFRVQESFENEVDIEFSDEELIPGAETEMTIRASPGSLCGVGVVDKSVHILGGDNRLKADKIFSSLDRYQLTSSGGYIEESTRCEPDDEYPQFFPLGRRRKRSSFLPGYGAKYQDSSRAFMDMGLVYITNMDVDTSPCIGNLFTARNGDGGEGGGRGPVPIPLRNEAQPVFDDDQVLEKAEIPSNALDTAPRIRSYFPETWLWDLRRTDSVTGEASLRMTVPDTVTEWIGGGFCVSQEYGVGISEPTTLRAFQPFFLSYTLPYSVVRGEVVPITVTVFNYLSESLVVAVSLELNDDFMMARNSEDRQLVCVRGSESLSVEFHITPRKLGNIALQAVGISVVDQNALCGNEVVSSRTGAQDIIYKQLLVEAEGAEVATTYNCYFCPEEAGDEYKKVFNVTLPASIVEGSARGRVSVTGDLMGPSLSNLDRLISLPTGCGEQNMLGFVPNIVALSYLSTTDQLTPSIENEATFNMRRGYQRELNYRHSDGSYSAFGESDPEGSTWLTAFVVRSYAQAQDYIYIDEDDLEISIKWLKSLQDGSTGCFATRGQLCHKDMKGGVDNGRTLTSYVVITLLEAGLPADDPTVIDGLRCITEGLLEDEEEEDTYSLALLSYALTLAESPLTDTVMDKLETRAVTENGLQYWQSIGTILANTDSYDSHQAPSTDIEMTSYILMAKLAQSNNNTIQALRVGNPIARWIVQQRNSNGGFSSTQDTVVALQALSEFAKVAYSEDTNIKAIVRATPLGGPEDINAEVYPFTLNTFNRLVLQDQPLATLPSQVTLYASGAGCALMQVSTIHNEIPEVPEDAGFDLDVLVLESYESSRNKRCTEYFIKVCASYTGSDGASNMAIVQVKMISGFYPDKESLRLLQKQHEPLQRFDVDDKDISFYFNQLTNEGTCLVFTVTKDIYVEDAKPGLAQVYDYYDKDVQVKKLYDITCEDNKPSWDGSLLFTVPVKSFEGEAPTGAMRPLPFVRAALRSADIAFEEPLEPLGELDLSPEGGKASTSGDKAQLENTNSTSNTQGNSTAESGAVNGTSTATNQSETTAAPSESDGGDGSSSSSDSESDGSEADQNRIDEAEAAENMMMAMKLGPVDVFILCPAGQKFVDGLKRCIPINGCHSSPCLEGQNCIDTDAGHLCVGCEPGYRKGAGNECIRLPDPSVSLMLCGAGEEFVNGACRSLDQCSGNPCPVGARCRGTRYGHTCEPVTCPPGRRLTSDLQCEDINECLRYPCPEGEVCINRVGGYYCEPEGCADGYERNQDNVCVDIDECERAVEPCGGPQYFCVNDKGSYQCFCVEGYIMDLDGYCVEEQADTTTATPTTAAPSTAEPSTEAPSTAPSSTASPTAANASTSATPSGNQTSTAGPSGEGEGSDRVIIDFGGLKAGRCPANEGGFGICGGTPCLGDEDCPGDDKCCQRPCGKLCMAPAPEPVVHPGVCPMEVGGQPYCQGEACVTDGDCRGGEKCCAGCGGEVSTCMPAPQIQPPVEPFEPLGPGSGGQCPKLGPAELGNCDGQECRDDSSCFENEKCCGSACGYHCTLAQFVEPPPPDCEGDLVFNEAGPVCEETCLEGRPSDCLDITLPGCSCPEGTIRVDSGSTTCVSPEQCPDVQPVVREVTKKEQCTGDLSYNDCGTQCPLTCAEPDERACIRICVTGCFCPPGMIRESAESDRCFQDVAQCTTERALPLETCTGDLVFDNCGTACPLTCADPEPRPCTRQCVPGCYCPSGQLRVDGNDTCVEELQCPQVDPPARPCEEERTQKLLETVRAVGVFVPQCSQDGFYAASQCHGSTGYCWCANTETGAVIDGTEVQFEEPNCEALEPLFACTEGYTLDANNDCVVEKPCPTLLAEAQEGGIIPGEFVPSCTEVGQYEVVQCHGSTGYCWCVDVETGVKFAGSDVRGQPDCSVIQIEPVPNPSVLITCPEGRVFADGVKKCVLPRADTGSVCTGDLVASDCTAGPCTPYCNQPEIACAAVCVPGCQCPAGMVKLAEDSDVCVAAEECPVLNCEEGYVLDESTNCVVETPCADLLAETQEGVALIGRFVPSCTEEGRYEVVQCHGSTGFCWCVDVETGVKFAGSDVRGQPDCSVILSEGSPPNPEVLNACPEGRVFANGVKKCVLPEEQCTGNMVYSDCTMGPCEPYCNQPTDISCATACIPGCSCPEGTVKLTQDSDQCVPTADCPGSELDVAPVCPDGQVYTECGSACPEYCDQPEDTICISMCVAGCFCGSDSVLLDQESDVCIAAVDCPKPFPDPVLLLVTQSPDEAVCEGDLVYTDCGSACPLVCGKEAAQACIFMCVPGCACPSGLYRDTEDGNLCMAEAECAAVPFTCPEKEGRCPSFDYMFTDVEFECSEQCKDDFDCEGSRKCCDHDCGSVCFFPSIAPPQPYPQRFPPRPTSPPAEGITVETCPASDVAVESCDAVCASAADCGEGEMCCENSACESTVCLPAVTEQRCSTVPCAVYAEEDPVDLENKVCGSDYMFIVKMRSDGRAKVLDDLKFNNNPYAGDRPIVDINLDAQCSTGLVPNERFIIFTSGPSVNLREGDKFIMVDNTALVMPMTGHRKNTINELKQFCPIA